MTHWYVHLYSQSIQPLCHEIWVLFLNFDWTFLIFNTYLLPEQLTTCNQCIIKSTLNRQSTFWSLWYELLQSLNCFWAVLREHLYSFLSHKEVVLYPHTKSLKTLKEMYILNLYNCFFHLELLPHYSFLPRWQVDGWLQGDDHTRLQGESLAHKRGVVDVHALAKGEI